MARKKVYKIKHYKTGYRRRKNNAFLKVFLLVVGCSVVFVLSYLLLGPLTDLIYDKTITSSDSSEPAPETETSSTTQTPEETVSLELMKTRVITIDELQNKANHSSLVSTIKSEGYMAVVIPVRTKDNIYFSTQNELALRTASVVDVGLNELIKSFKSEKINVIGEFSVFMDDKLPRVIYGSDKLPMAVRYKNNPKFLAIDYITDAKDEGGITWLSPESKETREYITDLAKSAAATGVDGIIFTNYNYVVHSGAVFTDAAGFNKVETLKAFSSELKETLKGINIMFMGTTAELKDGNINKFGGKLSDIADDIIITADKCDDELINLISQNKEKTFSLRLKECNEETLEKLKIQENVKIVLVG